MLKTSDNQKERIYLFESAKFNATRQTLELDSSLETLDYQLSHLLKLFLDNPQRCLSKQEIMDSVWQEKVVTDHSLTVAISKLRKVFKDVGIDTSLLKTHPKKGYELIAYVETSFTAYYKSDKTTSTSTKSKRPYVFITILMALIFIWFSIDKKVEEAPEIQQAIYAWQEKSPERIQGVIKLLNNSQLDANSETKKHALLALFYSYKLSRHFDESACTNIQLAMQSINKLPRDSFDYLLATSALNFYYLSNLQTAHSFLSKAEAIQPKNIDLLLIKANMYSALGLHQEAIEASDLGAKLTPTSHLHLWERVWTRYMAGDAKAAKEIALGTANFARGVETPLMYIEFLEGDYETAFSSLLTLLKNHYPMNQNELDKLEQDKSTNIAANYASLISLLDQHQLKISPDLYALIQILAGDSQASMNFLLSENSLKQRTYLLWLHENPVFKALLTGAQIEQIKSHIWQSNNFSRQCKS